MFAVKGWSVDANALKPQTELFEPGKGPDGERQKHSKKRKRGPDVAKQDPNVRADDVGRLWDQHIDGKDLSKSQKQREERKKKKEDMREMKTGPYELPNAMSKPKGERHIERWEDIVLGTRAEKMGIQKVKGKKKKKQLQEQQYGKRPKENLTAEGDELEAVDVDAGNGKAHVEPQDVIPELPPPVPAQAKLTPMQSAMRQKLISARFRHLNETLYTEPSAKAQELFVQNPEMFEDYHSGFRQQVSVWPENPLNKFIIEIRRRAMLKPPKPVKRRKLNASIKAPPKDDGQSLPRTDGTCTIADLGCGDARLADTLTVSGDITKSRLKMHSFDLYSNSKYVTKADISNLPLKDQSVDVAVMCLALMGTNWISFIEEAHRVLRWKGELWIAEIKSRFSRVTKANQPVAHSVGNKKKQAAIEAKQREHTEMNEEEVLQTHVDGVVNPTKDETDVSAFVAVLRRRGFILKPIGENRTSVDLKNKMFVKMEFVKALTPVKGKGAPSPAEVKAAKSKFSYGGVDDDVDTDDEGKVLKPCLYKVR